MNLLADANGTWKWYGENDPYYGVLSHPRFRDGKTRAEFFATGEKYVEALLGTIRRHVDRDFAPGRVLDFGCGVGRVLIPLAKVSSAASGVDISPGMRQEASRNCSEAGLQNVKLVSTVAEASGSFDFIHSFLVFQHMPVRAGLRAMAQLCQKLSDGGVISIHFPVASSKSRLRKILYWTRCHIPGVNPIVTPIANIVRGRPRRQPMMQMNVYPLNEVLTIVRPYCSLVLLQITSEPDHPCVNLIARHSRETLQSG